MLYAHLSFRRLADGSKVNVFLIRLEEPTSDLSVLPTTYRLTNFPILLLIAWYESE